MERSRTVALVLVLLALTTGCAKKPELYSWGSYEDQVYALYSDPGKVPPEEQILELERDYQQARSLNRQVPPGYHAHLGYLYYQAGKADQAYQSLVTEKELYPEATRYMDLLLSRMTGTPRNP